MTQVVLLSVISAGSAVLGAFAGALGTIFGPAWLESRRHRAESVRSREDARFAAVARLGEALALNGGDNQGSALRYNEARIALAGALRAGEGAATRYADAVYDDFKRDMRTLGGRAAIDAISGKMDKLFAWLRGEITLAELDPVETRR